MQSHFRPATSLHLTPQEERPQPGGLRMRVEEEEGGGYLARSLGELTLAPRTSYAPPPVYALPPNGILDGVTGMKSNGSHQQVWRPSMPTVQAHPNSCQTCRRRLPRLKLLTPSHMHQQQKRLGGSRLPAGRRNRNNSNTKLASTHEEGEMMTIGSLPHASSGGCPYRQEETGPSHPKVKGELTDQTPMLTSWVGSSQSPSSASRDHDRV